MDIDSDIRSMGTTSSDSYDFYGKSGGTRSETIINPGPSQKRPLGFRDRERFASCSASRSVYAFEGWTVIVVNQR